MSSNLEWRPTDVTGESLSDEMKFVLRAAFNEPVRITMTSDEIPVLRGIRAGSNERAVKKDCAALIVAIEKHGSIDVEEVHR